MKLISEEIQDAEYLIEDANGKKNYKIKGVFLQSDIKNRNGRVYPKEIMIKEVNRYNKEFVESNKSPVGVVALFVISLPGVLKSHTP